MRPSRSLFIAILFVVTGSIVLAFVISRVFGVRLNNRSSVTKRQTEFEFDGKMYATTERIDKQSYIIGFDVKTTNDGFVMMQGDPATKSNLSAFLSVWIMNGKIVYVRNDASNGLIRLVGGGDGDHSIKDSKWHSVEIRRHDNRTVVIVDGSEIATSVSPRSTDLIDDRNLFVGGRPIENSTSVSGLIGSIKNIRLDGRLIDGSTMNVVRVTPLNNNQTKDKLR